MDLVDIYICYNTMEAQNARAILEEDGFEVTVHNLTSTAFPVADDANARITLQVLADRASAARVILHAAKEAEVLVGNGRITDD